MHCIFGILRARSSKHFIVSVFDLFFIGYVKMRRLKAKSKIIKNNAACLLAANNITYPRPPEKTFCNHPLQTLTPDQSLPTGQMMKLQCGGAEIAWKFSSAKHNWGFLEKKHVKPNLYSYWTFFFYQRAPLISISD